MDKLPKSAKRQQPKGGSRKGKPNKNTAALKEMILEALENAGGPAYLLKQANKKNPAAFMALIGKVLPMTVEGPGEGGAFVFTAVERRIVKPGA